MITGKKLTYSWTSTWAFLDEEPTVQIQITAPALFVKVWGLGWKSGGRGISLAANHYSYTWMQLLSSFLKWNRVCPWSSFIFLFMFILSSAGFYELPCNRYPNSIRVNSLNLFQCPENPTCRTQHLSVVKQFRATLCIC